MPGTQGISPLGTGRKHNGNEVTALQRVPSPVLPTLCLSPSAVLRLVPKLVSVEFSNSQGYKSQETHGKKTQVTEPHLWVSLWPRGNLQSSPNWILFLICSSGEDSRGKGADWGKSIKKARIQWRNGKTRQWSLVYLMTGLFFFLLVDLEIEPRPYVNAK